MALLLTHCDQGPNDASPDADEASIEAEASRVVQDWPIYRGDPQMQGISREDLAPPLEVAWTFEPPAKEGQRRPPFKASPVIAGGRVLVGGQDSNFFCLDLATGEPIWTFAAEGPVTAPGAVVEDMVFFGDTYGLIYGLNLEDGSEVWRMEADDKVEGGINALKVSDDQLPEPEWRIFVGSHDFNLYSLAAKTGERRWSRETESYVMATPSIEAKLPAITFGGCDGFLYVVAADSGRALHQVELGQYVMNSAAMRDGIAYVAHHGGEVVAIDVATGEFAWRTETGVEYHGSPAVTETLVIVPGTDKRLAAFDRVTGEEVWAFQGRRDFEASPVVCESAIWIGGMDGRLYAIDPASGEELWNFDLGAQMLASPALSAGTLVVCGEDGLVYGFRREGEGPAVAPTKTSTEPADTAAPSRDPGEKDAEDKAAEETPGKDAATPES